MRKVRNLTKRQKSLESIKSILDVKNTKKKKYAVFTATESTKIRIKQGEERIWEIEDRNFEIIQSEEIKEKE